MSEHAREYHFDFTPEEGMREFEANGYSFFWLNVMDRYVCGASHVQSFVPFLTDLLPPFLCHASTSASDRCRDKAMFNNFQDSSVIVIDKVRLI